MEQLKINPNTYEIDFKDLIKSTINEILKEFQPKEWMNLKEGAAYAGVCYNTFMSFRAQGLNICEIDGTKRVSKTEIDRFLKSNSF